ncbi:NUDIX hydrolase [Lactiplantibacillus modestisalitolerans]|uniref:NUDIX hydrolase n=1 Tax=Lactiplantibacillus modestisalitolerans TaxID=1457219 RepID=A0ABV5WV16_9LACO|nr:NUDIX domain-containing protein [Lactiplantibacillus modestisalitolerans]
MNDDKRVFLDYLKQIYDQANEHLREQEHKRDQVVTFYAVLISFIITTNHTIQVNFGGPIMMMILDLALCVIGAIVCISLSSLRGWHTQYLDAIYVINYAMAHQNQYVTVDDLKNTIQEMLVNNQINEKENKDKKWPIRVGEWFKHTISSTEDSMFYGVWIFSMVPLIMMEHSLYKLVNWGSKQGALLVILSVAFTLVFVVYFRHMYKLLNKNIKNAQIYKTWILDFDYYSNGKKSFSYYDVSMNHGILSIKQNTAGVVTVPIVDNRYLMIKIKRTDGRFNWEFPRGFVEPEEIHDSMIDYSTAARRELNEELNVNYSAVMKAVDLGEIEPDSGLIKSSIHAVQVELSELKKIKLQSSEKIVEYRLMDEDSLTNEVKKRTIIDGFTLSAITLSRNTK